MSEAQALHGLLPFSQVVSGVCSTLTISFPPRFLSLISFLNIFNFFVIKIIALVHCDLPDFHAQVGEGASITIAWEPV